MNAYEYAATYDNLECLKILIDFKGLETKDLLSLLECCVNSNAEKCFDFVFHALQLLFNTLSVTDAFKLKNIIEKIINFSYINFIFIMFKNYDDFTSKLFDSQLLLKLIICLNHEKINEMSLNDEEGCESNNIITYLSDSISAKLHTVMKEKREASSSLIKTLIFLNLTSLFQEVFQFINKIQEIVQKAQAEYEFEVQDKDKKE